MSFWMVVFFSFIFCVGLIPIFRWFGKKYNVLTQQRNNRWTLRPIPKLGGVAIFISCLLTLVLAPKLGLTIFDENPVLMHWPLIIAATLIFLLGLLDDYKSLSPFSKIIGQIICATIVVISGYKTNFFTPRITEQGLAQLFNILISYIWIIGITNAVNLIDNMDGLAGGISLIAAAFLSFFFFKVGNSSLLVFSLVLVGGAFGFLIFNFPPATIFMGDSGSQLLGFSLAVLAIARQPQASNILAVFGIPILLFLVPIFDTVFVTYTRILRGEAPWIGGKDHTSHRLVSFGLSEKKTLVVFYSFTLIAGLLAYELEQIKYWYSLVIVPTLLVGLALVVAFLSGLEINKVPQSTKDEKFITRLMGNLTYRYRFLDVILDFIIISTSLFLAYLLRYKSNLDTIRLDQYFEIVPMALASVFSSFWLFGIYKKNWRLFSIKDYITYVFATLTGTIFLYICLIAFHYSTTFTAIFYFYFLSSIFLGLVVSRSSFFVLQQISDKQLRRTRARVVILGIGPDGETAFQWIKDHSHLKLHLEGFFYEAFWPKNKKVHGLSVFGGFDKFEEILDSGRIDGIIVSSSYPMNDTELKRVIEKCLYYGCWIKKIPPV